MSTILGYAIRLAIGIALEASAFPKPGNVHRLRNFVDTIYEDFIITAMVAVRHLYRGIRRGYRYGSALGMLKVVYGDIVFGMVSESKYASGGGNTCLGTAIMLAPISVALGYELSRGNRLVIGDVLQKACRFLERYSTALDTVYLYKAIRIVAPSYIKRTDETGSYPNVWDENYEEKIVEKNVTLWNILQYSSSNDIVAKDVIECYPRAYKLANYIAERLKMHNSWNRAVVEAYLYQLSSEPDTLVIKKSSYDTALVISMTAKELLDLCLNSWSYCVGKLEKFDQELASKGINPGSTADIVTTAISIYALTKQDKILRAY